MFGVILNRVIRFEFVLEELFWGLGVGWFWLGEGRNGDVEGKNIF